MSSIGQLKEEDKLDEIMQDKGSGFVAIGHNTLVVKDEFVFGVNDQDFEVNRIEPSIVFATQVAKKAWIKDGINGK